MLCMPLRCINANCFQKLNIASKIGKKSQIGKIMTLGYQVLSNVETGINRGEHESDNICT